MNEREDRLLAAIEAVRRECDYFEWDMDNTADYAARHIQKALDEALKGLPT